MQGRTFGCAWRVGSKNGLRIAAGSVLLLLAAVLLPLVVYAVAARHDFQSAFVFWLVAFPAGTVGFYLLKNTLTKRREASYSDLDITFARLLKENNWQITASRLAEAAGISLEEAKHYLDEKVLVLDGRFSIDELSGEQIYWLQPKSGTHRT